MTRTITQRDIDRSIDTIIALAIRFEEARDQQEHESRSYWNLHDKAIALHLAAEQLMPQAR